MKSQSAYAEHVLESIRRIREDTIGGRGAFFASRTLQDAILRNLQLLCESTKRVDERYKQKHWDVNWRSIAGMRNVLVHDYFEVDLETVWQIVERDLPPVERVVRLILDEIEETEN